MLIDFHTHIFPDSLAAKAIATLESKANIKAYGNGTKHDLENSMNQNLVDLSIILSIATNQRQMQKVNDFAAEVNQSKQVLAFGSVYPTGDLAVQELHRIHKLGLCGIKFHPAYQEYNVDDEGVFPLYECCAQLGLIMVFHAGFDPGYPQSNHCDPIRLRHVADAFPYAKIVFAHLGGGKNAALVKKHLLGTNVYLDTAVANQYFSVDEAKDLILSHGTEKILFGTDYPWSNVAIGVEFIKRMHLTDAQNKQIFSQNALQLLKLKEHERRK